MSIGYTINGNYSKLGDSMRLKLLFQEHPPQCAYCVHSQQGEEHLHCKYKREISPAFSCRHYRYSPFKRIPPKSPALPSFDAADFTL